jgi:hypothetical protein
VTTGQSKEWTFTVTSDQKTAAFVVAWTDPPATPASSRVLVNNLDLVVKNPNGETFIGNDAGVYSSTSFVDTENNVEKVVIVDPTPGDWVVTLKGTNVGVGGSQSYSFVASASPQVLVRKTR